MSEHQCDRYGRNWDCEGEVPNGAGHYLLGERLCSPCYEKWSTNLILIDMVTGTVMNFDNKVVVVSLLDLDPEQQELYDEWNVDGSDSTIMELGRLAGHPITGLME